MERKQRERTMTGRRRTTWASLLILAGAIGLGSPGLATAAGEGFATLEAAGGQVVVIRAGQSLPPAPGTALERNDIVVTKRGRATVRFGSDGTVLRVGPDSRVQVDESAAERDVTVFFGRLWAHVVRWKERPTRFTTSGTIAAVRGTELVLAVESDGESTRLAVLEGKVLAQNDAGSLELTGGQSATARKGTAPVRSIAVRPSDAVQWALYYLPVLSIRPGELGQGAPWQAKVEESAGAWSKGDLDRALTSLEGLPAAEIRDPRFFTYRASLLLAAGSVEEAGKDLDQALKLSENDSSALALQSIVAVARNENDNALALARRSVSADPKSATAQIALSYAQQAAFDLEGARASLEKAVTLEPTGALAWARLGEIRSSLGNLDGALEAARKATELAPNLARTQSVLGFAHLTRVRTGEARAAFAKAIELDSSDPLPRLGLGLALIRDGQLAEGTKEIEVAVSLDPGQSLLRSYLGKAYFEAKREDLVGREYELAQQADPKDPTPYLYDAIAKQTTNRPVEALESFQKAVELNDNRAVYRSRLLLDSDEAARSASLGRVFSDLGFQNLALVEGWRSVNTDPSDFSAHRLLADSYAVLPRHEVARVSALLKSQLLQPLNLTPIQPQLGESNLPLVGAGGPGSLSFNEFNPLFNRDRVGAQGSFLVGEDSTLAGEGIVSGVHKKLSFSAGYSGYKTDGFRENADQEDQIANVFAQVELSPATSIQAEYRYRNNEYGDVALRFFPENYFPGERNKEKRHTGRLGARHSFSPGSILLASVTYQDARFDVEDDQAGDFVSLVKAERPETALGAEAQYLFRSPRVSVTAGVGYFDIDGQIDTTVVLDPEILPPPDNVFEDTFSTDLRHVNAYAYSNISPAEAVTIVLGVSGDFLEGDSPDVGEQDQFNPKFGLIWTPFPGTTLRGTAFKALKRTLVTDQTLEPTQVAGFNQFYDDINGTRGWRYGAALDQKIGREFFVGAEWARRDLEIPFIADLDTQLAERQDAEEDLFRGYVFATPHASLALRAEYLFERFESEGLTDFPLKLDTHRLPLGVSFFHPSGFSATATATYVDQQGDFVVPGAENLSGSDDFWTVDAAISYRLPRRYGFVAVGATNLFDEEFNFYDTDVRNPTMQPARRIYARVTLAF